MTAGWFLVGVFVGALLMFGVVCAAEALAARHVRRAWSWMDRSR